MLQIVHLVLHSLAGVSVDGENQGSLGGELAAKSKIMPLDKQDHISEAFVESRSPHFSDFVAPVCPVKVNCA